MVPFLRRRQNFDTKFEVGTRLCSRSSSNERSDIQKQIKKATFLSS